MDKLEERIAVVETSVKFILEELKNIRTNDLTSIYNKIECIVAKMNKPRLPMYITITLTILSSLVTGLAVFLLTKQ